MKYLPHGTVIFATTSIEEGLLLLANRLCEVTVKSCLARALFHHSIRICHFLVSTTHVHFILVVDNPDDVKDFFCRFKTESAHMINRLLGRKKRTLWCKGFDNPILLTEEQVIAKIAYVYANPAKDNLVETIDNYPGLSSWSMFRSGQLSQLWHRVHRPAFKELPLHRRNPEGYQQAAERILATGRTSHEFTLHPNAWMEAFGITEPEAQEDYNRRIIERVRHLEAQAKEKRLHERKTVIGRQRLLAQPLDTTYRPDRSGRRMWCLSENKAQRIGFIQFLKGLFAEARQVYERWKRGDLSVKYPPGLFPPSMPKLANRLSAW